MIKKDSRNLSQLVARNIKAERIKQGMTQEKLAALTGFSIRFISRLESSPQNIRLDKLEKFSTSLGIAPFELLRDDESMTMAPNLSEQFRSALHMMQSVYERCFHPTAVKEPLSVTS